MTPQPSIALIGTLDTKGDEITRAHRTHFELNDDAFVAEHLDDWLA